VNLAALASFIVALCKAVPAVMQLAQMIEAQLAEHRRIQAHADIDADRERITAQPWVCPRTCPHRGLHEPQPTPPPAGHA
jgi:hypothetical protein